MTARILLMDCTDPHVNLAAEEALLLGAPKDCATLFLWQNAHTVVIGAGQNAFAECRVGLLREEGGTLARRSTGGGAVYHDMGNLNFSFIVPSALYDVARQLSVVTRAVAAFGIPAEPSGRNDVTANGCKFSGNAFRLLRESCLHHGTLLVDADFSKMARYLSVSQDKLRAKGVKSVRSRVVNISELGNVTVESLREEMMRAFAAEYGQAEVSDVLSLGLPGLDEAISRYRSDAWNLGRSPMGSVHVSGRAKECGIALYADTEGGKLTNCKIFTDSMDETLAGRLEEALCGCMFLQSAMYERTKGFGEDIARCVASFADLGEGEA